MEERVLVCEKTGTRYKVSPTTGQAVYLSPAESPPPRRESNVVEKLGKVRKELIESQRIKAEFEKDFELEKIKCRMFRSALAIRRTYVECPECGNLIQAGDSHRSHCRHFKTEMHMRT